MKSRSGQRYEADTHAPDLKTLTQAAEMKHSTKARIKALKRLMEVSDPDCYIFFNYARELAALALRVTKGRA